MKQLHDQGSYPNLEPVRPYASRPGSWGSDATMLFLIVALMGFSAGLTDKGRGVLESAGQMIGARSHATQAQQQARGSVLMIGLTEENERNIALTISPRGYSPVAIPPGGAIPERIETGLVPIAIVDRRTRGAGRVLDSIRHLVPAPRVIEINGPVSSTQLAQMLLDVL